MRAWTLKHTIIAGVALILMTNVVVLTGAAYNRSGEPNALVLMTERELRLPYRYRFNDENSGLALGLSWRILPEFDETTGKNLYWRNPPWLNKDKLIELGFDVSGNANIKAVKRRYQKELPRDVLLVFEYNGAAYEESLKQARVKLERVQAIYAPDLESETFETDSGPARKLKYAKDEYASEKTRKSRLFLIDAGQNYDSLREEYADKTRFIVAPGQIELTIRNSGRKNEDSVVGGRVVGVSVNNIHVPYEYANLLKSLPEGKRPGWQDFEPRYEVKLAYGQRLEPWVVEIKGKERSQ